MADITQALAHADLLRFLEPRFTASVPKLATEARHGLSGQFLELFEPHTEADPAAMLVQFLTAFGNAVGRGPHFEVSGSRQRMNLFTMVVGKTSTGRKGTSLEPIVGDGWGVVQKSAPDWRTANGLSSGEGLISAVRDATDEDPGVEDKRLLVIEPEFSAVFARMRRDGNTLSAVVREAWDGKRLCTMTKNTPMSATEAHVSIVGNITPRELRTCLKGSVEVANGFGNRFLWVYSERRKSLPVATAPEGDAIAELTARLESLTRWASEQGRLKWSAEAEGAWIGIYDRLTEGPGGALEEISARGTTQVIRLGCIYALLDRKTEVGVEHLTAALAVWRYTLESAAAIFEVDGTGNHVADRVLEKLRATPEGLNTTGLHRALGNNIAAPQLKEALDLLCARGHVSLTKKSAKGSHYMASEPESSFVNSFNSHPPQTEAQA